MNIYGLIATIFSCITAIVVVYLIIRKPISIRFTKVVELPKQEPIVVPKETKKEAEPKKEEDVNKDVAVASMDAVIKAANELMGIETLDKEIPHGGKE